MAYFSPPEVRGIVRKEPALGEVDKLYKVRAEIEQKTWKTGKGGGAKKFSALQWPTPEQRVLSVPRDSLEMETTHQLRQFFAAGETCNARALLLHFRRRRIGQICLHRRNFIGGFYGALEILFLTPRKTTV